MYLTVSKVLAAFSSQPFTFTINGEDTFSVPVDLQVPADSPASYKDDGRLRRRQHYRFRKISY